MSEDETLEPTDDQQQEDHLKVLRKKAKDHDDAVKRAEAAERKLALRDAGIPNTSLGKLFEKGYDGDWADVEAIKAAAVEYGVLEPPEPEVPEEERAAHERVSAASAGAPGSPERDFDAELSAASTEEEFLRIYRESGRPLANRGSA